MKIFQIFLLCLSVVLHTVKAQNYTLQELVDFEICEYNYDVERRNVIFEYKLKILTVLNSLMLYHDEVDLRPNDFTVLEHASTVEKFHDEIASLENERDTLLSNIKYCDLDANDQFHSVNL